MSTKGCICQRTARRWDANGVCSTCGQRVLESQLTPVILATLTGGTGLVLWRNSAGFDVERKIRFGLVPGAADYIGLWAPTGRFVGVELKTERGRQRPDQKTFQQLVERLGGVYAICRNENDAQQLLRQLRGDHG